MTLELKPWTEDAYELLKLANSPGMTEHLGGPESPEKLLDRQQRYLRYSAEGTYAWVFQLVIDGVPVGSVNYWEDEDFYEMGWAISPQFHGLGYATAGVLAALQHAKANGTRPRVRAVPRVTNLGSNGVARKAGFALVDTRPMEYPAGVFELSNVWEFNLSRLST